MKKIMLRTKIEEAEQQLALAEEEVAAAIRQIRVLPRAEKVVTGRTIENALDQLKVSRAKVGELKALLDADDDP